MGYHHSNTVTDKSTVCQCNKHFGTETLHPLASVIGINGDTSWNGTRLDCYAIYLAYKLPQGTHCPTCTCDYSAATMLFAPPGYSVGRGHAAGGRLLLFHPDLTQCECLGNKMADYHFFHYAEGEGLHLSLQERLQVERCLDYIDEELHWGVDRFSCTLLCNKIELLLNYCQRYYCRQMILRHDLSQEAIARLTRLADNYLRQGMAASGKLPTPQMMATWAGHSEAYTSDMLCHETGFTAKQWIDLRRIEVAKQLLLARQMTIGQIAQTLAYPSQACFSKLFAKIAGCTPSQYACNE